MFIYVFFVCVSLAVDIFVVDIHEAGIFVCICLVFAFVFGLLLIYLCLFLCLVCS